MSHTRKQFWYGFLGSSLSVAYGTVGVLNYCFHKVAGRRLGNWMQKLNTRVQALRAKEWEERIRAVIEGGDNPKILAFFASLQIEVRSAPGQNPENLAETVRAVLPKILQVLKEREQGIQVEADFEEQPSLVLQSNNALLNRLAVLPPCAQPLLTQLEIEQYIQYLESVGSPLQVEEFAAYKTKIANQECSISALTLANLEAPITVSYEESQEGVAPQIWNWVFEKSHLLAHIQACSGREQFAFEPQSRRLLTAGHFNLGGDELIQSYVSKVRQDLLAHLRKQVAPEQQIAKAVENPGVEGCPLYPALTVSFAQAGHFRPQQEEEKEGVVNAEVKPSSSLGFGLV